MGKTFFKIIIRWISSGELFQCVARKDSNNAPGEIPWEMANEKWINRYEDIALPEFKILVSKANSPKDRTNLPAGTACI